MLIDIPVPTTGGEYMDAVVVVEWHVKAGDPVTEGQTIAVVETAKTATRPDHRRRIHGRRRGGRVAC
jgi:Pyruvate/2-oxoglutarate dehydrogenase complex, dihydrolipoamide acyltransferase (E2) component, and related enzymes